MWTRVCNFELASLLRAQVCLCILGPALFASPLVPVVPLSSFAWIFLVRAGYKLPCVCLCVSLGPQSLLETAILASIWGAAGPPAAVLEGCDRQRLQTHSRQASQQKILRSVEKPQSRAQLHACMQSLRILGRHINAIPCLHNACIMQARIVHA